MTKCLNQDPVSYHVCVLIGFIAFTILIGWLSYLYYRWDGH